jgi:hypothetical protein
MDFSVIDLELVAKLLLVLLIGIGPKIALVPFLEKTKKFAPEQQRAIGRPMVITNPGAQIQQDEKPRVGCGRGYGKA